MKKQKKKVTLDSLAGMVAKGFENTATKVELQGVKTELQGVKHELKTDIARLERGQEEIKLKLDNVA